MATHNQEDMSIDQGIGYPRAYAKLCTDRNIWAFSHGPPYNYTPYALMQEEGSRAKAFDEMFPIIDPKARPTAKTKIFVSLLWKKLNHLGNAGFDPEKIRVDPYGNVVYFHADPGSPLSWDIDHWFPCSRGGLTVPSNLRILQWQVCNRKHNKLEFLIPWWDLQLGISINQFLAIFASSNSDFRHRAFSWLFSEGESEELNASQTVDSHSFPQHFVESKERLGLAPAAIVVLSRRESFDAPFKSMDINTRPRSSTPIIAAKKLKQRHKENEDPLMSTNPHQAIAMARDSLKHRESTVKIQADIRRLDDEVDELQQKTDEEKISIQDLESALMKRKRRVEKCRRLAEEQSSYRAMLEKMIREAMHQSVMYKEQVRLNRAASSALYARLEAQKAICDSSERELYKKHEKRDEIEKQIKYGWENARKRSRIDEDDDNTIHEDKYNKINYALPENNTEKNSPESSPGLHKELRMFLQEEQKASSASLILDEEKGQELKEDDIYYARFPFDQTDKEDDMEKRKQRGKGNIEKWMQILLENTEQESDEKNVSDQEKEDVEKNGEIPIETELQNQEIEHVEEDKVISRTPEMPKGIHEIRARRNSISYHENENIEKNENINTKKSKSPFRERKLLRSESTTRIFRRIPSSPSLILEGMKKRVDCMGKKPMVLDDNNNGEDHNADSNNSFIKSSIKKIKKAVRM